MDEELGLLCGPVWILDNDIHAIEPLDRNLVLIGLTIQSFTDSEKLIGAFANVKDSGTEPQVILLDGALGGNLTGVDVARLIARMDTRNKTALIGYTCYPTLFFNEMPQNSRIESVIDKTDDIGLLITEIKTVLKRRQQKAEQTAVDHK